MAGDTLYVAFNKVSSGSVNVRLDNKLKVAGYFSFQSSYAAGGTITGISRSLSPAPASARAWVRHSGGRFRSPWAGRP